MAMTEEQKAILLQAREDIRTHGDQFDIRQWIYMNRSIARADYPATLTGLQCDTMFCIAGAIVLNTVGAELVTEMEVTYYAARGGSFGHAMQLFYCEDWHYLDESLWEAKPTLENALRAIDLFIAKHST